MPAAPAGSCTANAANAATITVHSRALNGIARERGQTLAQLAIAWVLRDERITSALIGASRTSQLDDLVRCLDASPLTDAELAEIDTYAVDGGINIWTASSDA